MNMRKLLLSLILILSTITMAQIALPTFQELSTATNLRCMSRPALSSG